MLWRVAWRKWQHQTTRANTTNIRMSKIRCLLEIWRTTSALPSWNVSHPMPSNYECCWKSQPFQFCFFVPLKRRFYPKPLKATCSQNFPKLFSLPRFGYFRIYPFPKKKKMSTKSTAKSTTKALLKHRLCCTSTSQCTGSGAFLTGRQHEGAASKGQVVGFIYVPPR